MSITVLSVAIAVLGLCLVSALFLQARRAFANHRHARHRDTRPGMADLLNYGALVADGVLAGKDGCLLAAWLYKGDDLASATDDQRELTSARINQALGPLGNGWMIHVDAVRRPAPAYPARHESSFPDRLTEALDEERRQYFEQRGTAYEGYFVLTLTWLPPPLVQRRVVEAMFDDEDTARRSPQGHTQSLIDAFCREVRGVESRLSAALRITRLRTRPAIGDDGAPRQEDELLRWLHYCVTGLNHPIVLPRNPAYIDQLIGGQELWGGVVPRVGRHLVQTVAITGFPMESTPGMLSLLAELPCEYRWSTRFIFMERHRALADLEAFRKRWRQRVRGFYDQVFNTSTGPVDQDAQSMVEDAEGAMAEVNSGLIAYGYYTSVVVLMASDRAVLEEAARLVERSVAHLGFASRTETINTLEAYLGSLPGHGLPNVRRPLVHTLNLADLLPTASMWTGSATAPCPHYPPQAPALMRCVAAGSTPFRLNLHTGDLGHTIVFGPTRAGKSTLLGMLCAQARRYAGMRVYVFEAGLSMYPLAAAVRAATAGQGARHDVLGPESNRLSFCPLQFLATREDRAWAMEWIDALLALNGVATTPQQRNEIGMAVVNMQSEQARTLSEFRLMVQDNAIRSALEPYTVGASMGGLLDADSDSLSLTDFSVFEIGELMGLGDRFALPVLLYLFRRIERQLDGRPALIVLDEAWLALGHPVFRARIRQWLKTLAKLNCAVVMATQNLSDAAQSGILDVIMESTASKIFLPNPAARADEEGLYRRFGLNDHQRTIVAGAIRKRQYFQVSEPGCRLFELALGPLALALVGSTDRESLAEIRALEARHGDHWIPHWLERCGVTSATPLSEALRSTADTPAPYGPRDEVAALA